MDNYTTYPDNWNEMREAVFKIYGGKYCKKGIFKKLGHKGCVHVHHYIPLSKAENLSENYFLNQPWNLIPYCEKHHKKIHPHMGGVKGVYNPVFYKGKTYYGKRFVWFFKRRHYKEKFDSRIKGQKVLNFWNYWSYGENKLKKKMYTWPKKLI